MLACLRRTVRPTDVPPRPRIRSLAFLQPVIEELKEHPSPAFREKLAGKCQRHSPRGPIEEAMTELLFEPLDPLAEWGWAIPSSCAALLK